MVVKRGGLGKNLSALLNAVEANSVMQANTANIFNLAIDQLQPGKYQPRSDIDETSLLDLASSIKQQGLLQPLVVRAISSSQYELIAGERRWRACKLIGMHEVPVIVRQVDDETAMAMALVENLQREDLNAMDQARAMLRLHNEFALTHQQIATLLSKSRTSVSNYLRLLNLTPEVCSLVENGKLEMGHARCLLALDEEQQITAANLIIAKEYSVRATEALVVRIKADKSAMMSKMDISSLFQDALKDLTELLKTKIKLKQEQSGRGSLIIYYEDANNLQQVLGQLNSMKS